jgi:serine protease
MAVGAAVLLTGSSWFVATAQDRASAAWIADLGSPAIDRGLRDNDPPRQVRTNQGQPFERHRRNLPYVPGSVIVKFRAGTADNARQAMMGRIGGVETRALPNSSFDIVAIDDLTDPEEAAQRLDELPDVEYAQARYRVYPMFKPNDPLYVLQWNYPAIDMERAWDINPGATPAITVAVLDTGVAFRSGLRRYQAGEVIDRGVVVLPALDVVDVPFAAAPELGGPGRFAAPRDFIWNDADPVDLDGHGTHVAGTIGQLTNNGVGTAGMAFNVRIMPVKVVDGVWDLIFNSPFVGTDDVVARGIRYAADNGAHVVNMSIGRIGARPAPVVEDAIVYAVSRGTFVVVAAGNEFLSGNPVERLAEFAPRIEGLVSVGAVDRERRRASYSSVGSYVELVAPGGDSSRGGAAAMVLQQTFDFDFTDTFLFGPGYRPPRFDVFAFQRLQGTSMAAPHVAGFAALLMQQGITSPAAVEATMKRFATDLGPTGRDDEYGFGLIDPRASLRGLGLLR